MPLVPWEALWIRRSLLAQSSTAGPSPSAGHSADSESYPVRTYMDETWESEFQQRMRSFGAAHPPDGTSVSLKVRVTSGCFHREHSPHAYALIDSQLASVPPGTPFDFVEHESGPEVLVYLAAGTAGLALAKSVIDLVVAIANARREGVKKGDRPSDPIELIVRRVEHGDAFLEETVLRINHSDPIDRAQIEALLDAAVERLAGDSQGE